jgi:hypothetical protein
MSHQKIRPVDPGVGSENRFYDRGHNKNYHNGILFDNRWRCERSDQKTLCCHFSSVDVAPRKRLCTFLYRIYPKENIVYACTFFIQKADEISGTLRLMHDGIGFDKILPKQVGYFGTRIK